MSKSSIKEELAGIRQQLEEINEHFAQLAQLILHPSVPPVVPRIDEFGTLGVRDPHNPCATCPSNPALHNEMFIGDTPCQWCNHSGLRNTCSSDTNSTSNGTNKSQLQAFNNIK